MALRKAFLDGSRLTPLGAGQAAHLCRHWRHRSLSFTYRSRLTAHRSLSFTLIELLVVMLIVAILAGITLSVSRYANWRARQARSEADLQKIRSALDEYRAVYGEYPIVGDLHHYPVSWPTDAGTSNNVPDPYRRVDLVSTNVSGYAGVEYMPFAYGGMSGIYVDYRLTYPLKMRPESEGRPPFMDFPLMTVCYLLWKSTDIATHEGKAYDYRGFVMYRYLMGDPVNRIKAVNPATGCQWRYECTNGTTYTLSTWGW